MNPSNDHPEDEQQAIEWPPLEIQKEWALIARGVAIGLGLGSTAVLLAGVYGQAAALFAMVAVFGWSVLKMREVSRNIWNSRDGDGGGE